MKMQHILAPVDFSKTSGRALQIAARLAEQLRCRLSALFVGESFGADQLSAQEEHLRRFAARWIPADVSACRLVAVSGGAPPYVADQWARDHEVDLLVCGTHGRSGVRRLLLGSVAATLVRLADCPVWVERGLSGSPPIRGELLVASDFSAGAAAAARLAASLAVRFSLGLHLVHVLRRPDPVFACEAALDQVFEQIMSAASAELGGLTAPEGLRVRRSILVGDPTAKLVELADSESAPLLVCGRRGRSGWRELLIGSVAEKLTRLAPCPVLTVPAQPPGDVSTDGSDP